MERILPGIMLMLVSGYAIAQNVTIHNFARAETETYFFRNTTAFGAKVGDLKHIREPVTAQNSTVIRQNQDTLYSGILIDLSRPVEITLPATEGRYMSMHVINQDHYMFVESKPGTYRLTQEDVGSRFAMANFRTFVNSRDPDDIMKAHQAQDGIVVEGGGKGPFTAPNWDQDALALARKALSDLATLGFDTRYAFGRKEEVRPVDFLVGVAAGWGGLPASEAMYIVASVAENDGAIAHAVTVKDVPVDAFWSFTVYDADGYFEANDLGINSYNNVTAKPDDDGSITIHFGSCDDQRINCIPITKGWNYVVRMYQPREEILNGSWVFPTPLPIQ